MYRTGSGRPFRPGPPLHLSEMLPHHRAAWQSILSESVRLRDARRSFEMTGGQCLSEILKRSFLSEYTPESQSSPYVDIIADKIAEPSKPNQTVRMLDVLPKGWAHHYSSESNVLSGGCVDPHEIADVRKASQVIGGSQTGYVKYFARGDVRPLWDLKPISEVKSFCSFKAVMKKNGVHQRKILATLEKNVRWGPPPRTEDLGLYGGMSLGNVIPPEDRAFVANADQENCFTYVETPPWFWPYMAAPPLPHFVLEDLVTRDHMMSVVAF